MVITSYNIAMKSAIKHIGLLALAVFALASCNRFDPEELIVNYFNMPRCMKPVQVKTEVENNTVTLRLKVFNDAEKYLLEIYNSVIYEDWEPTEEEKEEYLVEAIEIPVDEIPYTFTTIEDVTLYYRVSAVNERAGREQSYWTVGKFKTSVNPETTCLTLEPEVNAYYELIKFFWQPVENEEYVLEIYNEALPSSGEPDAETLYKSLTLQNEDIPYSEMFPVKESGKYYYRVKAVDKLGVRKDSKWTKGSFEVKETFAWPTDETAFDYGVAAGVTKTADITDYTPFGISGSGKQFSGDKTVDRITWRSKGYWYTGPYMMYNRVKTWEDHTKDATWAATDGSTLKVATDSGLYFKINKPGTFSMDIRLAFNKTYSEHGVTAYLVVPMNGVNMVTRVYYHVPTEEEFTYPTKFNVNFEVTKDMLFGMEGPATIYIWHAVLTGATAYQFNYYAPSWTPSL